MNPIFTPEQIEYFIEFGYCMLPGAFTAQQAAAATGRVWQRMEEKAGIRKADSSTWPAAYDIEEHLTAPEVSRVLHGPHRRWHRSNLRRARSLPQSTKMGVMARELFFWHEST